MADVLGGAGVYLNYFVVLFSNPFAVTGIVISLVIIGMLLYNMKFNKDPYWPFKKHQPITVIELKQEGDGLVFVDSYPGKAGDKGVYLKKHNIILPSKSPRIPGSRKDLLFVGVSDDGIRFPLYLTPISLSDTVEQVIQRIVEGEKKKGLLETIAELPENIKKSLLVVLRPRADFYNALAFSVVQEHYQMLRDAVSEAFLPEKKGLISFLTDKNVQVWGITLTLLVLVALFANSVYDSLTKTITAYNNHVAKLIAQQQAQNQALLRWAIKTIQEGRLRGADYDTIYAEAQKAMNVTLPQPKDSQTTTKPSQKPPLIDMIPSHGGG